RRGGRERASRLLHRRVAEDEALVGERDEDQREREAEERRDPVEVAELAEIVEEHLRDGDEEEAEAHPAKPDAPPADAERQKDERVSRPREGRRQVARRQPLEAHAEG